MEEEKPASTVPQKSGLDKSKKIFRAVIELSKRLDEIRRQKPVGKDVFTSEAISLRHRLRELCLRLMFQQPVTFGRRAEDILWRKAFYDIIHLIRHGKSNLGAGSALEASYRSHLRSATGFYQHLLLRLQREFGLQLPVDVPSYCSPRTTARSWSGRAPHVDVSADAKNWALNAAHRTLICLGDIARYNQEWSPESSYLPLRYYHQALAVSPEKGSAHNQIGTLCNNKHYGIHAAYRYMRSLTCCQPFEGAEGNLKRLLEKNNRRMLELSNSSSVELSAHAQQHRDVKTFLVNFLRLMELFEEQSEFSSAAESALQQQCHSVLHLFNSCLFYLPPLFPNNLQPDQAPTDGLVFELVTMSIMTVYRLQLKQSTAVAGALAFLLALFSHLLNHCVLRLQTLYQGKVEETVEEEEKMRCNVVNRTQNGQQVTEKSSKRVAIRRQRRRRPHEFDLSEDEDDFEAEEVLSSESEDEWISSDDQLSSDSDALSINLDKTSKKADDSQVLQGLQGSWTTLDGTESFGGLSSDAFSVFSQHLQTPLSRLTSETLADNDAEQLQDESEARHIQEITQKMANFVFDTDTETALPSDLEKDHSETEVSESYSEEEQLSRVLQAAATDSCLKAVKVMCDWLTVHPNIIASAAQSSLALWSRLAVLLNCLPRETDLAKPELYVNESLLAALQAGVSQEFSQHVALSEDVALKSFPPLHSVQQSIDFNLKHLDSQPQAVIRICCLRKFGYMLAAMPGVDFQYDTEQGLFVGPQHKSAPTDQTQPVQLDQDQRRGQLMRDMAQLRLQAEVSRLESSLQQESDIPAYLVTDSSALLQQMTAVRMLVTSQKSILVIPNAAIASLDILKTSSTEARDVIRWFEKEFRSGNRHLRPQQQHEDVDVGIPRGLKKTEPLAWRLLVGLSCALYIRREARGVRNSRGLVAQLCVLPEEQSPALSAAVDALGKEGIKIFTPVELLRALSDKSNDVG